MPQQHRPLDWLARRHAGESAGLIASRAGVNKKTVLRETRDFGPFPPPTQRLNGRTVASAGQVSERTARWIRARRRGLYAAEIAAAEGVSRQLVSSATVGHGPFPSADTVTAWVDARHNRRTVSDIGLEYGIPGKRVAHHTAPYGPFPRPPHGARIPDGLLGISAIAERLRLSSPTVIAWRRDGRLPRPDFVTDRGRDLWLASTIDRWVDKADWLETCPECGARCVSMTRHRSQAHP